MLSIPLALSILSLISTTTAQITDVATLSASIKYEAGYSLLPGCINQCVWDVGDNDTPDIGGDLAIHMSCSAPWPNGCYCRGESAAFAYSFLTSCFNYLCTTPAATDIDKGVSIYTSYCSQALGAAYTPNAVPEPAPADGVRTAAPSSVGAAAATSRPSSAIPKQTGALMGSPNPTATAPPSENTPNDDGKVAGLSKGAFIGVVISASCSIIGLFFGIAFKVYKHKKQTRLQRQQLAARGYYQTKA